MFTHDIIKIKYVRLGYLPDWPPHLLADDEMCDAFLKYPEDPDKSEDELWKEWLDGDDPQFFRDYYYLSECRKDSIDYELKDAYRELVKQINYHLNQFKQDLSDSPILPDWIYSYMLGECVGPKSDISDIHDFISLMGVDNLYDDYNNLCAHTCLDYSGEWLNKRIQFDEHRPPTPFGEPHVVKYLRVLDSDMIVDEMQVE